MAATITRFNPLDRSGCRSDIIFQEMKYFLNRNEKYFIETDQGEENMKYT